MQLNRSDLKAVSEGLRELYAHTDSSSLPHCVVRLLHRFIPADSAVYNSFDFRSGEMFVVHDHGPEGDRYLPALQQHIQQHPLLAHVRAHWRDGAASLSDVASNRQLRDMQIYCEFLHPLRIEKQLGLMVQDRQYGVSAVALQRDGKDFSRRDKDLLTFLQPHIIQAFKNASDLTRLKNRVGGMEGLANLVDLGVIWLSSDNTIEWMSNLSERWLREYFPRAELAPSTGPRQLSRSLTSWIGKQKSAQQTAAALGWRAEQTVLGPNGSLSVRWLCDQPDRSYLILSEHRTNHLPEKLRSLGLTVRETEVLHWVAEGKSNEAIGILLGLSRRTVDKHMENVLRKLAVESRTEAALKAAACQRAS